MGIFILLFDIFSNAICILLTYKAFNKHYLKLCKYLDLRIKSIIMINNKPPNDSTTNNQQLV